MYNVSNTTKIKNAYNDIVYNENRKLKLSMYLNGKLIDVSNILDSVSWEWESLNSGYTVGNVIFSKVEFSLYKDVTIREMMDVEFTISIEIEVDGVRQWLDIPFGKYRVTSIEQTKLLSKVVAYDKFYTATQYIYTPKNQDRVYDSQELCEEIATTLGFEIIDVPYVMLANEPINIQNEDGTVSTQTGTNFDGWTSAELLGLIGGACGGNFFFNRDGKLKFVQGIVASDVELTESQFTEPTMNPIIYEKLGLHIVKRNDLADIYVGEKLADTSPQLLKLENPLFTQLSASSVMNSVIKYISYQPIATSIIGIMPLHLEPLDYVRITYDGKPYNVPCFKLNYKYASSMSGSFECYVETTTEQAKVGGGLNSKIESIKSNVDNMQVILANSITSGEINASSINALKLQTETLQADIAEINTLVNGNLTSDNIQSMNITANKFTMQDGFIKNAHIYNVNADKMTSGSINTSLVNVISESGQLAIKDNTIQIMDSEKVRVQIGKDASGDYSLYVWDIDGNLMFDALGIKEHAIKQAIIRDDMVSDTANINASKINIQSLFTAINEDGSNTLNSSKIYLDSEKQTLNVAFNSMKTTTDDLVDKTNTLTTDLSVEQGKIATLIKDTTIENADGTTTKLKDAYSQISQDVGSINLQVGQIESTVGEVQGELGNKVNSNAIISSINLSTEGVKINGDRLELKGDTVIISGGNSQKLEDYISSFNTDTTYSQEDLVRILNGIGDGFYLVDGKLFINAEYLQSGTVRADLVKVDVQATTNLLPFNFITMNNAINSGLYITKDNNGVPFANCNLPIYQGGGSTSSRTFPFAQNTITLEQGEYWFAFEVRASWDNDTRLENGQPNSTVGNGKTGSGLGNNLSIMLANSYSDIESSSYLLLGSVRDFDAEITVGERDGYVGVNERKWTRIVGKVNVTSSFTGQLFIELDGSGFNTGSQGQFYIKNLELLDASAVSEVPTYDYLQEIQSKRIELSDGKFYSNYIGVDGIQLHEGSIHGASTIESREFDIDYKGFKLNSQSDNTFMGEATSYYSYDGGSSGQLEGYEALYGIGCSERQENGDYEGIFVGVHHGYDSGRADIYRHARYSESENTLDWADWELLGDKVEPRALVRRDDSCNITTNDKIYFNGTEAKIVVNGTEYDLVNAVATTSTTEVDELKQQVSDLEARIAQLEAMLNNN